MEPQSTSASTRKVYDKMVPHQPLRFLLADDRSHPSRVIVDDRQYKIDRLADKGAQGPR